MEWHVNADGGADNSCVVEDEEFANTAISKPPESKPTSEGNAPENIASDKQPEWVEWRESSDSVELPPTSISADTSDAAQCPSISSGELLESDAKPDDFGPDKAESCTDGASHTCKTEDGGGPPHLKEIVEHSQSAELGEGNQRIREAEDCSDPLKCEEKN